MDPGLYVYCGFIIIFRGILVYLGEPQIVQHSTNFLSAYTCMQTLAKPQNEIQFCLVMVIRKHTPIMVAKYGYSNFVNLKVIC